MAHPGRCQMRAGAGCRRQPQLTIGEASWRGGRPAAAGHWARWRQDLPPARRPPCLPPPGRTNPRGCWLCCWAAVRLPALTILPTLGWALPVSDQRPASPPQPPNAAGPCFQTCLQAMQPQCVRSQVRGAGGGKAVAAAAHALAAHQLVSNISSMLELSGVPKRPAFSRLSKSFAIGATAARSTLVRYFLVVTWLSPVAAAAASRCGCGGSEKTAPPPEVLTCCKVPSHYVHSAGCVPDSIRGKLSDYG